MKNLLLATALLIPSAASADFILPENPGQLFITGTTEELTDAWYADHEGEMPAYSLWGTMLTVPIGLGAVDCMLAGSVPSWTGETYVQDELPQACLDQLAFQYCGPDPVTDWPITCMWDGWCCQ